MSHTPGPWKIHRAESGVPFLVITDDETVSIAYVGEGRAQVFQANAEANARLIAAAPELLVASRRLLSALVDMGIGCNEAVALSDAILKATKGTP